jgi:quinol---cytochrome c reductase iron-sulfur subunit
VKRDDPTTKRVERAIGVGFLVAALAGLALLGVYLAGGQTQLEAILLAICLGGIGLGITAWSHWLLPGREHVEERHSLASPADQAAGSGLVADQAAETASITRRSFLTRTLAAAFAGLAAALAVPALSLGPAPGNTLFVTPWKAGSRVVGLDGLPVHIDDLPIDGVLTVFPEGAVGSADGQTLLIRVADGLLQLPPDRLAWAPEGCVAYSKLCTHAGCPVGLYRAAEHKLICPCHQSTFDVLDGANPTFGPAARALPQLPIQLASDGTFVALGDFPEPVGPGFWDMTDG